MRLSRRGKRRLLVLVLAAVAVGAGIIAFNSIKRAQERRMAAEARAQGLAAYQAGDLPLAIENLSYFFEQDRNDLEVNLVFAEARSRLPTPGGRHLFEAADLYTNHCLDLIDRLQAGGDASHAAQRREVLQRLLSLYAQMGDRDRVSQTADALLKDDPDMISALSAKAEVLFLSREFADAEVIASHLIDLDPDNLTWRKMLLEVRSRQGATHAMLVEQCRQWSEQYTGDARFRLLAAAMLVDAGRTDDARAELHEVGHLSAKSRVVLEQLVSLLDALGLPDEAEASVASAVNRFPTEWWPHEVSMRRAWQNDNPDQAVAEFETAKADLGEPPASVRRLEVASLIAANRRSDAVKALQPLLKISPADKNQDDDRLWALAVSAVLRTEDQDWRTVADALQTALSTAPHEPILQFLMGDASMQVGEQARAIVAYREAYQAAPNWSTAGVAYGNALLHVGRLNEAHQVARLVVSRGGVERLQPFLLLARTSVSLRETGVPAEQMTGGDIMPEIIDSLEQIREQLPDDANVSSLLLRAWLVQGRLKEAQAFLNQVLAEPGSDPDRLLALADITRGRLSEFEEPLLIRAEEIGGLTVPLAFERADLLARRGDFAQGLKLIDAAIAKHTLDEQQRQTVGCARAAYLLRMDASMSGTDTERHGGMGGTGLVTLSSLLHEFPDSVEVQRFALSRPEAWSDQRLIAQAMGNLHRILGDDSLQVRLAEANFLIQHHGREPAMLARAIVSLNEVLDQAPDSLAALSLAAEALMLGEHPNLDRAATHLERAVRLYPGEPSLLVRLIAVLQRQGRFDSARMFLQMLASMNDARLSDAQAKSSFSATGPAIDSRHPIAVLDELRLLQAQGDFETALVRASATVNEASPPAQQLLLAAAQEQTGHLDEAEKTYARLLEVDGGNPMVIAQAAEFYASTGRYARGMELLEAARVGDGMQSPMASDSAKALMIGMYQQRHGRVDEAEQSLRRAVDENPQSTEAYTQLSLHYLAANKASQARDTAMVGLRVDPEHDGLRSVYAIASLAMPGADRAEAIAMLRKVGAKDDALLAMLELLDRVPVTGGREAPTDENLAAARRLTETHGLFLPAWQLAVSLHVQAGRVSDAIVIARGAISRLPGEPLPAQWATQLLMQQQRWDEALVEGQEWRRRTMANPLPADAALARILITMNRADQAAARIVPHKAQILDDRQQYPDRVLTLVEALLRTGDVRSAEAVMTPLLAEGAAWREAWITAAALMPPADAQRVLDDMSEHEAPASERLALAMAWLALSQRSGSEAFRSRAEETASAIEHDPITAVGASITLGSIAEDRGDLPAAERHYRSAVNAAPDNPVALNNLAYVLALQGRFEDALPLIDKVLKASPNQPDFLDTRAVILNGLNQPAEAEAALKAALETRPDDPSLMLSLAQTQMARALFDDAALTLASVERRSATLNERQRTRLHDLKQQLDATSGSENINPTTTKPAVP